MVVHFDENFETPEHSVCIVGAGPAGIALALACETRGWSVLLIESGGEVPSRYASELSKAEVLDASRHAPMELASCRALGGTSHWWGGRCVPFDDIDFSPRPWVPETVWPIGHEDVRTWYHQAADFFRCGPARFESRVAPWRALEGVALYDLERWAPRVNVGLEHKARLAGSSRITVVLGATVTALAFSADGKSITALTIADPVTVKTISVGLCVLACGGLETTRLLLAAREQRRDAFGGPGGALGRHYMGHISGKIADLVLEDPGEVRALDYFLDDGVFARRRFTLPAAVQREQACLNIAFWADNPPFHDPAHKSGVLSLVWLALAVPLVGKRLLSEAIRLSHLGPPPFKYLAHLGNIFSSPWKTLAIFFRIVYDRFLHKPRKPGFLVPNEGGRYALHYHAEHLPGPQSRVTLASETDALGVPRLTIDLRYCDRDAESVLRAHELLDKSLRAARLGRLDYRIAENERMQAILTQAGDGFHQLGTTRMGEHPDTSVVDRNCRVHGISNLYIASTSVFPSSGQANPTLLVVAMALRLAEHLTTSGASDDAGDRWARAGAPGMAAAVG